MTYATLQTMTERFGEDELIQRTDRYGSGQMDEVVLHRALSDADAEVNSYLAVRYVLPLAGVPTALTRVAADVARYRLYDDGVPEAVRQRYDDAVALLKRMASGDVKLVMEGPSDGGAVVPEVVRASGGSANAVKVRTPARQFGAGQLPGY